MKVEILFDKEAVSAAYCCGWGLSYLIDRRLLFDTGENYQNIAVNAKVMGIDLAAVEKIVISHNHWDHRAGLFKLLENNPSLKVFATDDLRREFIGVLKNYNVLVNHLPFQLEKNIFTSGILTGRYKDRQMQEQALAVKTDKGVSIFCGCSHPGVLEFVKTVKKIFAVDNVFSLIGGFHFIEQENRLIRWIAQELKRENVSWIGPAHCTGFAAETILREFYPDNFLEIKSGAVIEI
jgi:7,8-dihydropterin-6-yl-methyl-4-(beta-D-ribofuranosyl)aminobenzene 5'-phosphate synthase